jgi:DNA gyrase subunit A
MNGEFMQRPDLNNTDPGVRRYIEFLEKKLGLFPSEETSDVASPERLAEILPSEPETTLSILNISRQGLVKRTFRHHYSRQHRGGMGVFDMDISLTDSPAVLGLFDQPQTVILLTTKARAFRYSPLHLEPSPVRAKGGSPFERLGFDQDETIAAVLPEQARGYIALLGESGRVRCLRHHLFGEHMRPGTTLFNLSDFGLLTSACWTPGDAELLIVSSQGMGIRFPEKAISPQGDVGIRVSGDDKAIGITSVTPESEVFLLGSDGRGTIRPMSGFAANKSPGGAGKIAMKTARLVGAAAVLPDDDIFVITRLGKVIRFQADEVPTTEGTVQGVNCISMRMDEVSAFVRSPRIPGY